MARKLLIAALAISTLTTPVYGWERREPELLLRRPDGAYEAPRVPGQGRLQVEPRSNERRYHGVYDNSGRRIGTIERTPYGTNTFRDNEGRRR